MYTQIKFMVAQREEVHCKQVTPFDLFLLLL